MAPEELERVTLVSGDVTRLDQVERVLDEHEITNVVHLAALQIPFCRDDPVRGAQVNVVGTVNVFEAAKRRRDRVTGVVYASSAAKYGAGDAGEAARDEQARARPSTHYGVYKQANEGTARIYWQDDGVPSIGVRPYIVYGPARDQGLTATPTEAMLAAARGEGFHIPYGGRYLYNYAPDVARMLVTASRACREGAVAANVPGTVVGMDEVVAAIETAAPEVAGKITFDDVRLPFPSELATGALEQAVGPVRVTPFGDGVRETIAHFRAGLGLRDAAAPA